MGDSTEAERQDGISGRGAVRAPRRRIRHSEPLPVSTLDYGELYGSLEIVWRISAECEDHLTSMHATGRPRESKVADMLICLLLQNQLRSARAVNRFVRDSRNWSVLAQRVAGAFPDNPERRLSSEPPTRFQNMRIREAILKKIPNFDVWFREEVRDECVRAAKHAGCGTVKDSLTHPSKENMLIGDATWEQALFNGVAGRDYLDPETGEVFEARSDPDARPFHSDSSGPGNYFVSVLTRTEFPRERFMLDAQYKPDGIGDGTVFTDMALGLFGYLPAMRGAIYDMALKSLDQDRIGSTGRHVVCKVPHTKKGKIRSEVIGLLKFKTARGEFVEQVVAIDGSPVISVVDIDGNPYVVPLVRKQSKLRGFAMYNRLEIPDDPLVPMSKRGATTWLRMFSSTSDIEGHRRRPTYLRSIPPNDPDFGRLFGLREDTESMHNDYKSRLTNRRARSVGLLRREFDLRGYQIHQMAVALMSWSLRTGGDVSSYLGNWKPPEHLRPELAA